MLILTRMFLYSCLATIWLVGFDSAVAQTTVDDIHNPQAQDPHTESSGPVAGHSFHAEVFNEGPRQAAYLINGTGLVDFPVSTENSLAQQFFNQGVGQLHGFWYFEAERSFRQAAACDGRCAMFYWGMAMANLKNPERAAKFIAQAKERLESASDHEKKWIEAVGKFCTTKDAEGKEIDLKKRAQQYTRDLEEILFLRPSDLEVKAFLVGHLWENQRKELATVSHVAVDALLQQIFDVTPMHPAHHYRIHLWDQRDAKQALASAALCGQSGPGIAHMWHMPGHIYSGLHRYSDAVWQMEASARVDHQQMLKDRVLPDQIHNYAHNNEWLTRNLAKIGQVHDALALADNMLKLPRHPTYNTGGKGSGHYGRQRSLQVLSSYRMWNELLNRADRMFEPKADDKSGEREMRQQIGMAAAFTKQCDRLEEARSTLQKSLETATAQRAEKIAAGEKAAADAKQAAETSDSAGEQPPAETVIAEKTEPTPPEATNETPKVDPPKMDVSELDREIAALEKSLAAISAVEAAAAEQWTDALAFAEKADGIDGLIKAEWQAMAGRRKPAWDAVTNEVRNRPNDAVPLAVKVFVAYSLLTRPCQVKAPTAAPTAAPTTAPTAAPTTTPAAAPTAVPTATPTAVPTAVPTAAPTASDGAPQDTVPNASQETVASEPNDKDAEPTINVELLKADFESLRTVAGRADLDTPLLMRLEPIARFLDLPVDWRLPQETASDVGQRPDLESLGPLHWTPSPASTISVTNVQGSETSVLASPGKAKIVLFYLGFGCLHCMEQLQKFAPQSDDFSQNNIEIVAVSCEPLEILQQGIQNYQESLTIPLYSDGQQQAFKAFRCYDDFENQPLHGTFLIAPDGRILWQDIGHEPFMDVEFLKNESKRLLEVWQD
ncbi:MAG: redoxin domain-containing protein [Pirellulaceae bacterium]|nr:redoxin domain-containing protein [Pirellulaceae bacterium]